MDSWPIATHVAAPSIATFAVLPSAALSMVITNATESPATSDSAAALREVEWIYRLSIPDGYKRVRVAETKRLGMFTPRSPTLVTFAQQQAGM